MNAAESSSSLTQQRDWSRVGTQFDQVEMLLVQLGRTQVGQLKDKSLGGIGLLVQDASCLHLGQQVIVNYYAAPVPATIRRLQSRTDGTTEVGVQWDDDTSQL